MPVTKRADASTLSVVSLVKENIPKFQAALPPGVVVSYEFDQSPYVTRAIKGLTQEGLLGAVLTGLMVLLFLRDWRSAFVVVFNIPLAILAATLAMWISGQTVNIMTLGGLALAVGILVDEATVTVENIHTHLAQGQSIPRAARDATTETTLPRLLAMLCILAVFIPALFMKGAAKNLFIPLALAVGFAMVASYLLSSTFVPIVSVWLLRHQHADHAESRTLFDRFRGVYASVSSTMVGLRWLVVPAYLIAASAIVFVLGRTLGREIFPIVDAGQFTLRLRAPTGTRIETTEQLALKAIQAIKREAGGDNSVQLWMGFVGVHAGAYPVNLIHLWTSGPEEAVLQVQLNPDAHVRTEELKERLRQKLPQELAGVRLSFEPSDIVSRVMSFGSTTPIEIAIAGTDFPAERQYAQKLKDALAQVPALRDLQFQQELEYPAIKVEFDRARAAMLGVTADQTARSLTEATSSSRYTAANYWADPKSGVAYQVQVQVPIQKMDSINEVRNLPIANRPGLQLDQVATVTPGTVLGEYDRYNMQRMFTLGANISGEDLGRASDQVGQVIRNLGDIPPKVSVAVRGQIAPMQELFSGLTTGLGVAVLVIFLLLAANFQSFRLSLAVILTTPAVIAGVVIALALTRTTLNIQSFMGAIMAIGVAVANAIMLITFAERNRVEGALVRQAAVQGASSRLRPILMTSFAMIAGMLPMAIGAGEGGEQTAPLGRAVIGGLIGATFATLLILPGIFAILQRDKTRRSASIDPEDPASPYFERASQDRSESGNGDGGHTASPLVKTVSVKTE
jgi:multidrug efflux pump subunit AcrB